MANNKEDGQDYQNPSYDKTLSIRDRLGDFLGKYHVILNGVVKHDPYIKNEEDGGGMCCQHHKMEIIEFVEELFQEEIAKLISYGGYYGKRRKSRYEG